MMCLRRVFRTFKVHKVNVYGACPAGTKTLCCARGFATGSAARCACRLWKRQPYGLALANRKLLVSQRERTNSKTKRLAVPSQNQGTLRSSPHPVPYGAAASGLVLDFVLSQRAVRPIVGTLQRNRLVRQVQRQRPNHRLSERGGHTQQATASPVCRGVINGEEI